MGKDLPKVVCTKCKYIYKNRDIYSAFQGLRLQRDYKSICPCGNDMTAKIKEYRKLILEK